uniref:TROVE domain-containing protein n=1 Tax=Leersia perrieri TaxID=77586 RepID=A0A0D9VCY4_9ORYZ
MATAAVSTASHALVGPPEARRASSTAAAPAPTTTGDAFLDLMDANFNKPPPRKSLTENLSPTFVSSGDACLDFFFHVVPGTPSASVSSLLAAAWAADPSTALRLVANLRGVRGTGKSDREGFYAAALWLHQHHPSTLALNAASVAAFGYLKDLPELLHRIVNGGFSTRTPGKKARLAAEGVNGGFVSRRGRGRGRGCFRGGFGGGARRRMKHQRGVGSSEERIAASLERDGRISAKAAVARRSKRAEAAARAVERYSRDPTYRFLHDRTADLFADLLREDMRKLAGGELREFSLAAKWCPSLDKSYDRSTLLCEAIARRLFPRGSSPELAGGDDELTDAHYAYRARERLRKAALVPLRRALKLPEVFISARAWESVVYTRVASVAMKNYKDLFAKHDGDRFNAYLADVKSGQNKIAAGALLPHEIIASLSDSDADISVADLQWQRMVDDMRAIGKLRNCLAVCDVSGSMSGLPMDVCVALGLLVSDLSDDPWRGRVITFSERPQLHRIAGETLSDKVKFISSMDWGMNTDLQKVFDRILEVAVSSTLSPEKMVRRVVVFSDMEFDEASSRPWETDYEAIARKFAAAGYAVPEVVFWNLRDSKAVPVTSGQKGVALVSGFSKNLLKLFLDGDGVVSPRAVMEKAIAGPEYDKLAVFD